MNNAKLSPEEALQMMNDFVSGNQDMNKSIKNMQGMLSQVKHWRTLNVALKKNLPPCLTDSQSSKNILHIYSQFKGYTFDAYVKKILENKKLC